MNRLFCWSVLLLLLGSTTIDAQKGLKPCGPRITGRCKPPEPPPPPPPAPIDCVQGAWFVVSQSISYSDWVTRGDYQERQRTTTVQWARDTQVQPANGGALCGPSTQTTVETITETQPIPQLTVPPIPALANWQSRMTSYGATHCSAGAIAWAVGSQGVQSEDNVWYYDGTKVYEQIATYTQNPDWYTCAGYTNTAYQSWVLAVTNGMTTPTSELSGWRVFPHGLAKDYWRTGKASSRDAALRLGLYSAWAGSGGSSDCGVSRETAYVLNAYLVAEELGAPRHPQFDTAVYHALNQLHKSLTNQCDLVAPFMMGLTMESLIHAYEKTGDPRIPPAIESAADAMWTWLWHPATESFVYVSTNLNEGAPDLNLLIAPAYAWLWQLTGAQRHLDRGDAIC